MDLVTPALGLVVWTTLCFAILLFILGKYAWKPIMNAVAERENSIESALSKAEAVREEMSRLTAENEAILKQARAERDTIIAEGTKIKNQLISEAKESAQKEGARQIELARQEISTQKAIALADVKNQVASLSLDIAEKILRKQFEDQKKQDELVKELLKEVKLS
jgi:F-type H+-transporting ATPase subunit b